METVKDREWPGEIEKEPPTEFIPEQKLSSRLRQIASAFVSKPFTAHPFLRNPHAQTVLAAIRLPRYLEWRKFADGWENRLVEVEPGAQVLVKCRWQDDRRLAPTIVVIHGLEGSSESLYVRGISRKAFQAGFNVVRMNQRTCGGTEHLTPTLYHSGLTGDIERVFLDLVTREQLNRIFLVGYSMSGNMLLKIAGDYGAAVPEQLTGICAVSPTLDLKACADAINWRGNWLYRVDFLYNLRRRIRRKRRLHPDLYDTRGLWKVRSIRQFDDRYTAPHGGYRDALEYYERTSSNRVLREVRVPSLILHSVDDPFVPPEAFGDPALADNPDLLLVLTTRGGHTGFISAGREGEDRYWAENRVVEFCRLLLQSQ